MRVDVLLFRRMVLSTTSACDYILNFVEIRINKGCVLFFFMRPVVILSGCKTAGFLSLIFHIRSKFNQNVMWRNNLISHTRKIFNVTVNDNLKFTIKKNWLWFNRYIHIMYIARKNVLHTLFSWYNTYTYINAVHILRGPMNPYGQSIMAGGNKPGAYFSSEWSSALYDKI